MSPIQSTVATQGAMRLPCLLLPLMLLLTLLVGCASNSRDALPDGQRNTWKFKAPLTQQIGLISDTQFHESRGAPSPIVQSAGDEFVEVTIRSAQQVIGADDILQHALKQLQHLPLLVHAGDAMDLSCSSEWQRFQKVMTEAPGRRWVFTPGNHDGYLSGNVYPTNARLIGDLDWVKLCDAGMGYVNGKAVHAPFRKNDVIQAYAKALGIPLEIGKPSSGCNAEGSHCWEIHTSQRAPWESFMVQLVRLPPAEHADIAIYAVLLDSSNYLVQPTGLHGYLAGRSGELSPAQLQAAVAIIKSRVGGKGRYFLIAHHPLNSWHFDDWDSDQRAVWQEFTSDARWLNFAVTSHTHKGNLFRHPKELGGIVELNTGSLADPPIYLRTLQFEQGPAGEIGFVSDATQLKPDDLSCKDHPLPGGQGPLDYGVETQRTEFSKASDAPWLIRHWRQLQSARNSVGEKVPAKHRELKPQLLLYADLVDKTFPAELALSWSPKTLKGSKEIAAELRSLATCSDEKECPVTAKENLLLALESAYREGTAIPPKDREEARQLRLCAALGAAADSPSTTGKRTVNEVLERIEQPWSLQLSPRPTKP